MRRICQQIRYCLLVLPGAVSAALTNAESAPSTAVTGLQQVAPTAQASIDSVPMAYISNSEFDASSAYRRDSSGAWPVPKEVDPSNTLIPCVLLLPEEVLRIDFHVTLDGKPFRKIREEWIDAALDYAQKQVRASEANGSNAADVYRSETTPSTPEWLLRYAANLNGPLSRHEARWMLAQRTHGPALLELYRFSTERSASAPLRSLLDANADGDLDRDELDDAATKISATDRNQDHVIALTELHPFRSLSAKQAPDWHPDPLLLVLERSTADTVLDGLLHKAYERSQDSLLQKPAAKQLRQQPPVITVHVRFGAKEETPIELLATLPDVRSGSDAVAVLYGRYEVEFGAASLAPKGSQVSMGAVMEGLPLWEQVDSNHDGQLSELEVRDVTAKLRELDANADGALSATEMPRRVRVGIVRGTAVHDLLAAYRPPVPRIASSRVGAGPPWFASMDANSDGDLSKAEFLGSPDQFRQLDVNSDGIITPIEAAASSQSK